MSYISINELPKRLNTLEERLCELEKRKDSAPTMPTPKSCLGYTVKEFTSITKLGKNFVYKMINAGELRCANIKGTKYIPVDELNRLCGNVN